MLRLFFIRLYFLISIQCNTFLCLNDYFKFPWQKPLLLTIATSTRKMGITNEMAVLFVISVLDYS